MRSCDDDDDDDDECKLAGSSPNVCKCTYICKGFGLPNVAEFLSVRIHLSSFFSFCHLSFSLSCFHLFFFLLGSSTVVLSGPVLAGTATSQLLPIFIPFRLQPILNITVVTITSD